MSFIVPSSADQYTVCSVLVDYVFAGVLYLILALLFLVLLLLY